MRLKKKKKQYFCLDFGATRVRTVDAGEEKGERGIESTACCLFFFLLFSLRIGSSSDAFITIDICCP